MKKIDCVLLIDDHFPTNFLHKVIIEDTGNVDLVFDFTNPEEALDYLKADFSDEKPRPTFIFLDINMPQMSGWEFLEEYAKLPPENTAEITVLMLSTSSHPDDLKRAQSSEIVNEYLYKPLSGDTMIELFNRYLGL